MPALKNMPLSRLKPLPALTISVMLSVVALTAMGPSVALAQVPFLSPRDGAPPAPSAITVRLLAVVSPTQDYLVQSSQLAEEQASAKAVRAFARREASLQTRLQTSLVAATVQPNGADQLADPLNRAATAATGVDGAAQSILADLPDLLRTPGARALAVDHTITAQSLSDLAQLIDRHGSIFDAFYVETQKDGLLRLAGLYGDYVENGDDPALRAVAVHALPLIKAQIAALRRGLPR